jgi:hypothetical protein
VTYGIAIETSEGLTNLADINDGRAVRTYIVTQRQSGSATIPASLSSAVILISALVDPIPGGQVRAQTDLNVGVDGTTLSWDFLDSSNNLVQDGLTVHVTIILLGED